MSKKRPQVRPEQVPIPAKAPESEPEPQSEPQPEPPTSEYPQYPPEEPAPDNGAEASSTESPQGEQAPEQLLELEPSAPKKPAEPPSPRDVSLFDLYVILVELRALVHDQHEMLIAFQNAPVKGTRRAPMLPNGGKVQVVDKTTGEVFPSKNGAYQTLLKRGALKELVAKGVFGDDPAKNSFGWYALKRAWPDRFEEQPVTPKTEGQGGPQANG
jgi:hypothetical protein